MIQTWALVVDTFREAMARKVFWGLFGLSTSMVLFLLLLLRIDIVEGATATFSLFGIQGRGMDLEQLISGTHAAIAAFLYSFGMFLAIFASASLTPSLLEPGRIELLVSKPIPRWHLLLGRYLGNLLLIALNSIWLAGGAWLVLGMKAGLWDARFLITLPATVFVFAVLLTVVMLLGVVWESTAVAVMVPAAVMVFSPILAQEATISRLFSSEWPRALFKAAYWAMPKVHDIGRLTFQTVRGEPATDWLPMIFSSVLFAAAILGLAVSVFSKRDF